jgi:hypothetical protein
MCVYVHVCVLCVLPLVGDVTLKSTEDMDLVSSVFVKLMSELPETLLTNAYYADFVTPHLASQVINLHSLCMNKIPEANSLVLERMVEVSSLATSVRGQLYYSLQKSVSLFLFLPCFFAPSFSLFIRPM